MILWNTLKYKQTRTQRITKTVQIYLHNSVTRRLRVGAIVPLKGYVVGDFFFKFIAVYSSYIYFI